MSLLSLRDVSVSTGGAALVTGANLEIAPGELVALVGPNGAGKTSLLRAALGLVPLASGTASLGGRPVGGLAPRERARAASYLPQTRPLAWPNRVRDLVALGRFAHGAAPHRLVGKDTEAVEAAIAACGLFSLADRQADTLSGGELARVHCARAIAAGAPLLVADEPVAALDPLHQFQVMSLIAGYAKGPRGALVVLHDLNLAARFATRFIWMKEGRIVADGPPGETLTEARIAEVFGVRASLSGGAVRIEGPA